MWVADTLPFIIGDSFIGKLISRILSYYIFYPLVDRLGVEINVMKIKTEVNADLINWAKVKGEAYALPQDASSKEIDDMVNKLFEAHATLISTHPLSGM